MRRHWLAFTIALAGCRPPPEATPPPEPAPTPEDDRLSGMWPDPSSATEPVTSGALDRDTIDRVVRTHGDELRRCYTNGLARNRDMKGIVRVRFIISPTGTVAEAKIDSNELGDAEVGECIRAALTTWVFPAPQDGGNAEVVYPFQFGTR